MARADTAKKCARFSTAAALNLNEAQERLVDEGRGLEGVVRAFVPKVALRETPKLLVNDRYQLVEGAPVPIAPPLKEPRHIARRHPRHPRIIFRLVSQSSTRTAPMRAKLTVQARSAKAPRGRRRLRGERLSPQARRIHLASSRRVLNAEMSEQRKDQIMPGC